MLFGGFYINSGTIPVYYAWIKYISFFRYGYEILVYNELHGLKFTCTKGAPVCIPTGDLQLQQMDMTNVKIWENFLILVSMVIVYRILTFISLTYFHHEKR